MKKRLIAFAAVLCLVLAGCDTSASPESGAPLNSGPVETGAVTATPSEPAQTPEAGKSATLYIGTGDTGFREYPLEYEGELTPELLIQGISDLTGWDLTLPEPVTTGKGGMSVCLSDRSALFVGPPDPQKDEFHMFDAEQLAHTILDSIQKTLQAGFTGEGGDPNVLDIYYYMEGEKPLTLPDLGLSWPLDQPYRWPAE